MTSETGQRLTSIAPDAMLSPLAVHAAHGAPMVRLYSRHRQTPRPPRSLASLPRVTVRLSIRDEVYVVVRDKIANHA